MAVALAAGTLSPAGPVLRARLPVSWRLRRPTGLEALALPAALLAALPLVGLVVAAMSGPGAAIPAQDIWRYARTSAVLALAVGALTAVLGTAAAWLTVRHRFPGRGLFTWALALPLAAPAFAIAYAYADLFDPAGALRMGLRQATGHDLPVAVRSTTGAALILAGAFYPYVYLAMRAAFLGRTGAVWNAARMLGCSPSRAFVRAVLPTVRPALAAGVALAVMETLADYGAVQFLAVQTLTTGVVRAWSVFGTTAGAAQLALPLLGAAGLLLWAEARGRTGRVADGARVQVAPCPPVTLTGWAAVGATAFCLILLTLSLLLPAAWLGWRAMGQVADWPRVLEAAGNSIAMGVGGAVVTTAIAAALALGAARAPGALRLASLGYATPGAAIAIGLMVPAALWWRAVPGASAFGTAILLLLLAYAARLTAAALQPIDAGLARVPGAMRQAARTLGRGEVAAAVCIDLRLARPALLTAALIVFVDVLKELPATLVLRPFDFDTLAVQASNYALDERLGQAGLPALLIILIALPAAIWLTRAIAATAPRP